MQVSTKVVKLSKSWDKFITESFINAGFYIIGEGAFSKVYGKARCNDVYKVHFRSTGAYPPKTANTLSQMLTNPWIMWVMESKNQNCNPWFPKVKKLTFFEDNKGEVHFIAKMEKLTALSTMEKLAALSTNATSQADYSEFYYSEYSIREFCNFTKIAHSIINASWKLSAIVGLSNWIFEKLSMQSYKAAKTFQKVVCKLCQKPINSTLECINANLEYSLPPSVLEDIQFQAALKAIIEIGAYMDKGIDLHYHNLMIRESTGQLVITDPIFG